MCHDVNYCISHKCTEGQTEEELDNNLEVVFLAAFFCNNEDKGSEESKHWNSDSSKDAESPDLCFCQHIVIFLFMIVVMIMVIMIVIVVVMIILTKNSCWKQKDCQ